MGTIIGGIANVINLAFQIYIFIIIARALISWVSPDPYNPIVRFLHSATDPVLYRLRNLLPFLQAGTFDFSPIVLLILLSVLQQFVVSSLMQFAH